MADVSTATKFFPTAKEGFTTTTSGSISSGATSVGLNSVSGLTNGATMVFVIDPTDSTKKQAFTGVIDTAGSQVTGVVWTEGTNVAHSSGATVVDYETATHWALYSKGLLVQHTQAGAHTAITNTSGLTTDTLTVTSGTTLPAGDIATADLADSAVATAKIADDAVTDAKLIYGKLRSRQGGSATDWSTAGTTTYDYSGTNTFIQAGSATSSGSSGVTVTFPVAFNQVPLVFLSCEAGTSNFAEIEISPALSATQFTFAVYTLGGALAVKDVYWMAIGQ